jgi:hypothetical protein
MEGTLRAIRLPRSSIHKILWSLLALALGYVPASPVSAQRQAPSLSTDTAARRLLLGAGLGSIAERQFVLAVLGKQNSTTVRNVAIEAVRAVTAARPRSDADSALLAVAIAVDSIHQATHALRRRGISSNTYSLPPLDQAGGQLLRPYARRAREITNQLADPVMVALRGITDTALIVHASALLADLPAHLRRRYADPQFLRQHPDSVLRLLSSQASNLFGTPGERRRIADVLQYGVQHAGLERVRARAHTVPEVRAAVEDMRQVLNLNSRIQQIRLAAARQVKDDGRSVYAAADSVVDRIARGPSATARTVRQRAADIKVLETALNTAPSELERAYGSLNRVAGAVSQVNTAATRLQNFTINTTNAVTATTDFLNQANGLIQTLPVSQGLKTRVAAVQKYAGAAIGIAKSILTGNPLGVISALGGLFGGGPSAAEQAAEQRHQQIMEEFAMVRQELASIRKELDTIKVQLDRIDRKIDTLSVQVAANHQAVMVALDVIREDVGALAVMVGNKDWTDFQLCKQVRPALRAKSYTELYELIDRNLNNVVSPCLERLTAIAQPLDDPDRIDRMLWVYGSFDSSSTYLDRYFRPLRKYREQWPALLPGFHSPLTYDQQRRSFGEPSISYPELQAKIARILGGEIGAEIPLAGFERPLLDSSVVTAAGVILDTHPLWSFVGGGSANILVEPHHLLDIVDPTEPDTLLKGRRLLAGFVDVLNVAIAQQSMLDGDILLIPLSDSIRSDQTAAAIEFNPVLQQNVVRYFLYDVNRDRGASARAAVIDSLYAAAWNSSDTAAMNSLAIRVRGDPHGEKREVKLHIERGRDPSAPWVARLSRNLHVALPTPEEFARREFVNGPRLPRMVQLREAILSAIAGYDLPLNLPEALRRAAAALSVTIQPAALARP